MEKNPDYIISVGELLKQPRVEYNWIVDDLLRTGRRRISLLTGKPHSGKSTLARQLAVAVAEGEKFLSRQCVRGRVLLWQVEEDENDLQDSFDRLGYNPETDERIDVFRGGSDDNNLRKLAAQLEKGNYALFIGETLDDILRIKDINSNTDAREAFERFDKLVLEPNFRRTAFLMLHHLKKRPTDDPGEMILGASVIKGKSDAILYVDIVDDQRRTIYATARKGTHLPKTYLKYDPNTERASLGQTMAQGYKKKHEDTQQRIIEQIKESINNHPEYTKNQHLTLVKGSSEQKTDVWRELERKGKILPLGEGVKGDPKRFTIAEPLPPEVLAQFGEAA